MGNYNSQEDMKEISEKINSLKLGDHLLLSKPLLKPEFYNMKFRYKKPEEDINKWNGAPNSSYKNNHLKKEKLY